MGWGWEGGSLPRGPKETHRGRRGLSRGAPWLSSPHGSCPLPAQPQQAPSPAAGREPTCAGMQRAMPPGMSQPQPHVSALPGPQGPGTTPLRRFRAWLLWALRTQTQKPGLGSNPGSAASWLTTPVPRGLRRVPSSHLGHRRLATWRPCLCQACRPHGHSPRPGEGPSPHSRTQASLPMSPPCSCFPFLHPISFCILDTFWGPLN